ncbi:MAG: hypothetical protein JST66_04175 [Bacteroidetes bacterium]|nr:hypothetical protein [Bacteroidota bacterium]
MIFYDSLKGFAMHTGTFEASVTQDENGPKWQVAVHNIDANERLHPGFADPFEPYAVQLIEDTKGEIATVGFFTYLATHNGVRMGEPDSTTTPDVLFDEWVFGGGSDVHVFDEQSTMGQGMLETNYVQEGMQAAAAQAQAGDFNPFPIERNAGAENKLCLRDHNHLRRHHRQRCSRIPWKHSRHRERYGPVRGGRATVCHDAGSAVGPNGG